MGLELKLNREKLYELTFVSLLIRVTSGKYGSSVLCIARDYTVHVTIQVLACLEQGHVIKATCMDETIFFQPLIA